MTFYFFPTDNKNLLEVLGMKKKKIFFMEFLAKIDLPYFFKKHCRK